MTHLHILPKDLLNELSNYYLPTVEITKDSRIIHELRTTNLIVTNIHHSKVIDDIKYIEAENIFYDFCEKYTTKALLKSPEKFNNIKNIYVNSSPADHDAFVKFYEFIPGLVDNYTHIAEPDGYYLYDKYQHLNIYINDRFQRYYERWWTNYENMFVISDMEYQQKLKEAKTHLNLY